MKVIKLTKAEEIASYIPSTALMNVLSMSRALGRPLLLTGKPGTGKTQFADWYANKTEHFNNDVFVFNTKSTSVYTDLFYQYDAVSHFRNKSETRDVTDFITLTALGKAIVCAKGKSEIMKDEQLRKIVDHSEMNLDELEVKSVVLIDEIDKAPRDFPNDLLHEIESLSFTIRETTPCIELQLEENEKQNVVVLLTSNNEKNLPDAFLRRCLFHYIDFPDRQKITEIILRKLNVNELEGLNDKLDFFDHVFQPNDIDKKPSTSEWIDWVNYLSNADGLVKVKIFRKKGDQETFLSEANKKKIIESFSILFKKKDDLDLATAMLAPTA